MSEERVGSVWERVRGERVGSKRREWRQEKRKWGISRREGERVGSERREWGDRE